MMALARYFSLLVIGLLICGTSNAGFFDKKINVDISVNNESGENANIYIKIKNKEDETVRSIEKFIKKGESLALKEIVPSNGSIKWQYSVSGLVSKFDLPPREIQADSGSTQSITETLMPIEKYDDQAAADKLKSIARDLQLDRTPMPVKKAQARLGSVWIGDAVKGAKSGDGAGFSWKLKDVEVTMDGTISFTSSTSMSRKALADASVSVPIYGKLISNFESGDIYKVDWRAEHFEFPNTIVSQNPFSDVKEDTLKEIKSALVSDEGSTLCYIDRVHVVKYLSYASTKGKKVSASASAAYMSIFTADSSYIFDASNIDVQTMTDQVVSESFACARRSQVIALLDSRLRKVAPPPVQIEEVSVNPSVTTTFQ